MADTGNWADFLKSQLQWNAGQNRNLLFGTPDQKPAPTPPVFVNPLTGDDITSKITGGEGGATQGRTSQPTGYGGFNTGMGRMAGLAGTVAGGIPGLAMSLAGYGLGLGMGKAAPESLSFSPNPLGAYGVNVNTPEDVARAQAAYDALDEATRSDFDAGMRAKSRDFWGSLIGRYGPAPTIDDLEAAARGVKQGYAPMDVYGEPPGFGPGFDLDVDLSGETGFGGQPGGAPGAASAGDPSEGESGAGGSGADTSGGSSGPGGDADSGWAKGGVSRVKRTTRATYGEPGTAGNGKSGETAIFIPEMMKQLGLQGRERDVIRALREALRDLEGSVKLRKTGRV